MGSITREPIDHLAAVEQVRSERAGAIVSFLGTVRQLTAGRETASLDYEAYPEMAERMMGEIEAEARQRWPVIELLIVHRVGQLAPGEISVAISVSCPHRRQAFDACQFLIDRVKAVLPIWKCENWASGESQWVDPGPESGRRETGNTVKL